MRIQPILNADQYAVERAICDKAMAYASATMKARGKHCNYLTAEECKHPDYAACNNDMRGRVEQYEILRDTPDTICAYIGAKESNSRLAYPVQVWTGLQIGNAYETSSWRTPRSYVSSTMHSYRARIGDVEYVGRGGGIGLSIVLRKAKTVRLFP